MSFEAPAGLKGILAVIVSEGGDTPCPLQLQVLRFIHTPSTTSGSEPSSPNQPVFLLEKCIFPSALLHWESNIRVLTKFSQDHPPKPHSLPSVDFSFFITVLFPIFKEVVG